MHASVLLVYSPVVRQLRYTVFVDLRLTHSDIVALRVVSGLAQVFLYDLLVVVPLPLQEDALCEVPGPAYEGDILEELFAVNLGVLKKSIRRMNELIDFIG